jgi:hypothetical protein
VSEGNSVALTFDATGAVTHYRVDKPGETCCVHGPFKTCAEVQAQCATSFPFCNFCLYGPEVPPPRRGSPANER